MFVPLCIYIMCHTGWGGYGIFVITNRVYSVLPSLICDHISRNALENTPFCGSSEDVSVIKCNKNNYLPSKTL